MKPTGAIPEYPSRGQTGLSQREKWLYYLLLFFFMALFVPGITWLYNAAMWLIFLYSFRFSTVAEKWAALRSRKGLQWLLLFFTINLISGFFSHNRQESLSWIGIRISLLVFPFALGTIQIRPAFFLFIIRSFSGVIASVAGITLLIALGRALLSQDPSLLYNDNLTSIYELQSVYFALLVNLALIGYAWLWAQRRLVVNSVTITAILVLFVVQCLLASRISLIFLGLAVIGFGAYWAYTNQQWKRVFLVFALLAASVVVFFFFFPKTLNRFRELGYAHFNYHSTARESHFNSELTAAQWNGANIRLAIWESSAPVIKRHWLFGVGIGDKMDSLLSRYKTVGFDFGIRTRRNMHNTYLDLLFTMGTIGLFVFLLAFAIHPLSQAWRYRDGWIAAVTICFLFAMFPETYPDRTIGNTYLSFFAALIVARTAAYKQYQA
ncbi:MAG: O-antigen ligase family protein [Bacteroidota bacterium]|nr:O-antigen ligase family protein [Bacteroidota bacterium]